jgi:hypothetical protein
MFPAGIVNFDVTMRVIPFVKPVILTLESVGFCFAFGDFQIFPNRGIEGQVMIYVRHLA